MSMSGFARFYLGLKDSLLRFHYFSEQEIRLFQDRQFRSIVQLANNKINFYKNKFLEYKIDTGKIKGIGQIKNFPLTEPNIFFAQAKDARADKKSIYKKFRSSGTTGCPKDVYLSGFDWTYSRRLAYLRMIFLNGFYPFYKSLFLQSANISYDIRKKWFWKLGLMREKAVSVNEPKSEQANKFNQFKPDVLNCLTSDGVALAGFIRRHDKQRHRARCIFTTGEMLTARDKQEMFDILGENIIDYYASTEAGIIAWQCLKTNKYHINADQIYIETVDGQRICQDGEEGEVVLTTLTPCCSPLIRYRTGDIAVLEHGKCECGSSFPRLSKIIGRKNDFIIDSDGERISPYMLMTTMDAIAGVEKYQIIQRSSDLVTVHVKLIKDAGNCIMDDIKAMCQEVLGKSMQIKISSDLIARCGNKQKTIVNSMADVN